MFGFILVPKKEDVSWLESHGYKPTGHYKWTKFFDDGTPMWIASFFNAFNVMLPWSISTPRRPDEGFLKGGHCIAGSTNPADAERGIMTLRVGNFIAIR